MAGKKTEYTDTELKNQKCEVEGCSQPARYQWNCCADSNIWRRLCSDHDLELNVQLMTFMKVKGWKAKLKRYAAIVKRDRW